MRMKPLIRLLTVDKVPDVAARDRVEVVYEDYLTALGELAPTAVKSEKSDAAGD